MKEPVLQADFCLVPVGERIRWRNALACHLIAQQASGDVPAWKREEGIAPMRATIAVLFDAGVRQAPEFAERLRKMELMGHRNDYAASE